MLIRRTHAGTKHHPHPVTRTQGDGDFALDGMPRCQAQFITLCHLRQEDLPFHQRKVRADAGSLIRMVLQETTDDDLLAYLQRP